MSNLISAIRDDIDEYRWLCQRYGEKMQYVDGLADIYGTHCQELKQRLDMERERSAENRP